MEFSVSFTPSKYNYLQTKQIIIQIKNKCYCSHPYAVSLTL